MSTFEYNPILKKPEEDGYAKDQLLPTDLCALAWAKENGSQKKSHGPSVVYRQEKFKSKPIILLPCTPQFDNRKCDTNKIESPVPPVRSRLEPSPEILTAEHLSKYESNAQVILDWIKGAQIILAQPNVDAGQLSRLSADCNKGKIAESAGALRQSIVATVVPKNMPQLVESWQATKDKTQAVADIFPQIAKALADKDTAEASRLLNNAAADLNAALNDGFDRASALSDKLPIAQPRDNVVPVSADDKRKADQVKILSAYETLGYYVGNLESALRTLSERPFGELDAADWQRLAKSYRNFKREMSGLKTEFNQETMRKLEESNVLTGGQKRLLSTFRHSIEKVMPALSSIDSTSPLEGGKFTPVYSGLVDQMSDIRSLTWKISGKGAYLQTELNLKNEIKSAPDWKKNLLEQKLVMWQYYPLADRASDVNSAATLLKQEAEGAIKIDQVNKFARTRNHRRELLSAIDAFQADVSPDALKKLEEYDKCAALAAPQIEHLKQFRNRYLQVVPHIEAIRKGIEPTASIDLSAMNGSGKDLLDELSNDRRVIRNTLNEVDSQLRMRRLEEQTCSDLKPLVHQYKSYNEMSQISDAIDAIDRDARDILFLTGGYYSKNQLAARLPEATTSMLDKIAGFKHLVGIEGKLPHLASMIDSSDLTAQQAIQLKEFYDNVLVLIPQVDELENVVRLGADKHFWKVSRSVRDQMEKTHKQGFEITLAGYQLHRRLLDGMANK